MLASCFTRVNAPEGAGRERPRGRVVRSLRQFSLEPPEAYGNGISLVAKPEQMGRSTIIILNAQTASAFAAVLDENTLRTLAGDDSVIVTGLVECFDSHQITWGVSGREHGFHYTKTHGNMGDNVILALKPATGRMIASATGVATLRQSHAPEAKAISGLIEFLRTLQD
jgi:hypothetical protein